MKFLLQKNITEKPIHLLLSLFFLVALILTGWICDDAFITFRTVNKFVSGYGLVWNIGERVQAYTHPLWMFVLSGFYLVTKDLFYTTTFLSIVISFFVFYSLLAKISVSINNSIIVGLILIFSKAFIDYSTSGLENPLSHLLLVSFFSIYFFQKNINSKLLMLSSTASLSALNRLDTFILFLPVLTIELINQKSKKNIVLILIGFIPLFLWELFSIFYYGFPFPNTAYAKLNTGVPQSELIEQGLYYFLDSLYLDPLTFFTITSVVIISFVKREREISHIAIGLGLYIIYIIYIGGDFMSGRFLSIPLLLSALILSQIKIKSIKVVMVSSIIIIVLGFLSPRPNFLSSPSYSLSPKIINAFRFGPKIIGMNNGITDERFWYYEHTGLLNNIFQKKIELHPWVQHAKQLKEQNTVVVKSTVGLFGYYAPKEIHIIDQYALTDPLLSKLPATEYWLIGKEKPEGEKFWRIGHFARKMPDGYLETIETGENKIKNPSLSKYCAKLSILIKGDLFSWDRLIEIWNFNTGQYNFLLDDYNRTIQRDKN